MCSQYEEIKVIAELPNFDFVKSVSTNQAGDSLAEILI